MTPTQKARRAITPEGLHNMEILGTKRLITNETGRVIDIDTFWSKEYKSYIMTITPVKLIDHNGYITKSYCPADSYKVSIYQPSSGRQSKKALEQAGHIREAIYRHYAEKVANENGLTIAE